VIVKADVIMDLRNFVSWFSLLKITQVFEGMQSREILEIRGADPDTKRDLFKILPESTYEILAIDDHEDDDGFYQVRIQKVN